MATFSQRRPAHLVGSEAVAEVCRSFCGVEHRLELVGERMVCATADSIACTLPGRRPGTLPNRLSLWRGYDRSSHSPNW